MKKIWAVLLILALLCGGCTKGEEVSSSSQEDESVSEISEDVAEIDEESSKEEEEPPLETITVDVTQAETLLVPDESGNIPISTRQELALLAAAINSGDTSFNGKVFVLQNDINLNGYDFVPIGGKNATADEPAEFNATFDGGGNLIKGLTIRENGFDEGTGLFGIVGENGSVMNLHITGGNVTGRDKTGGVVGWNKGSLYNCSYRGKVTSAYAGVGAIAGQNGIEDVAPLVSQHIEACFANAEVFGAKQAGAFVGANFAKIANCYVLGVANAIAGEQYEPEQIGGFVGNNGRLIENCFASTEVYTKVEAVLVGGFAGYNDMDIRACFYNQAATANWKAIGESKSAQPVNVTGCTIEELLEQDTYETWDFAAVWVIDGEKNRGYPYLRSAGL